MLYQVLMAIIILIIIIYLIMILVQRNLIIKIKRTENLKKEIFHMPIKHKIDQIINLKLSGDSLNKFNKCAKKYENIKENEFQKINFCLVDAHNEATRFHLLKSYKKLKEFNVLIDNVKNDIKKIDKTLQSIIDLRNKNEKELETLKEKYHSIHQQILVKSFSYGDSLDKLDNVLSDVNQDLNKINELAKDGDYENAKRDINKLNIQIKMIKDMADKIPDLVNKQNNVFNIQLDELKSGYETMHKDHFNFMDVNIPEALKKISIQLDKSKNELKNLNIDDVIVMNHEISDEIDKLYSLMENEYSSRDYVNKQIPYINSFIEHALRQNNELRIELNRLSQNYNLNNNEFEKVKRLNQDIQDVRDRFFNDKNLIKNGDSIYSNLKDDLISLENRLIKIEQKQKDINEKVNKLHDREKEALNSVRHFEQIIYNIKRTVERQNLPGLSNDYLDLFFSVSDEIINLKKELDQERIDMDEISKKVFRIQDNIKVLKKKTNNLIDSALLSEQLLQYANRYRANNEDIELAIKKSNKLFNKYSYKEALDVLATAIDKVEPGAFQQIEKSYFDNRNKNLNI